MTDEMHDAWMRDQDIENHLRGALRELDWLIMEVFEDIARVVDRKTYQVLDDACDVLEDELARSVGRWD